MWDTPSAKKRWNTCKTDKVEKRQEGIYTHQVEVKPVSLQCRLWLLSLRPICAARVNLDSSCRILHFPVFPMVSDNQALLLIVHHVEIRNILIKPSLILRSMPTISLADPRILEKIWSPLAGLSVQGISCEPVDGIVHVVPDVM